MSRNRIKERDYITSVNYLAGEQAKKGLLLNFFNILGPKYRKAMYFLWQFFFTIAALLPAYVSYKL